MEALRRVVTLTLIIAASISVLAPDTSHAFRSTKQKGYTDPDYHDYRPVNIVLLVIADGFESRSIMEERLIKELAKYGVTVFLQNDLFPPTREWSEQAQSEIYQRKLIDSGIILTAGASAASVIPIATNTYSTTNVFGNYNQDTGSFSAHGSGSSTSYTIMSAKSEASFSAVLFDISSNRVAWYADIFTKAGGTLFVGSKGDAKGAVKGVINGLKEHGHIRKDKKN